MKSYQALLDALQAGGYKLGSHNGTKAQAQCPGHEDRKPSLSVTHHGDKTLIYCHGGCGNDIDRILAPLKLTPDDLFDNPRPTYTYTYGNGKPQRKVHRNPGKRFYQSGDKSTYLLYGIPRIREFKAKGEPVYFVEGEKDADTVNHLGYCATTAPQGAQSVGKVDMSELADADVIAVRDLDEAGQKWPEEPQIRLGTSAATLTFKVAAAGKDVFDHVAAGHPLEELRDDPRHLEPAEGANSNGHRARQHAAQIRVDVRNDALAADWLRLELGRHGLSGIFRRDALLVHTPRMGEEGYLPPEDLGLIDAGPAQVRPITTIGVKSLIETRYYCWKTTAVREGRDSTQIETAALFPQQSAQSACEAARLGEYAPHLRDLHGVTHTPTMRPDGSILEVPGYDAGTRMLYLPDPRLTVPAIPVQPTAAEVSAEPSRLSCRSHTGCSCGVRAA